MSNLRIKRLQLGENATANDNTTVTSNATGLIISRGNVGAETQVAYLDKSGTLFCNNIIATGGAISGDRNRAINGSCQIVNVASVASVGGSVVYGGPELFAAFESASAGGQFTQSQGSMAFGGISLPTVRQTVDSPIVSTASANTWAGILTYVEGFNSFDLRGKSVALSFVFNTNVSGTYSVSIRDSAASQSFVSTFVAVANTPVQVSIPASAIPLAASIPNSNALGLSIAVGYLNTDNQQTATLNQWQAGNFASAAGATNWGATAGNFIELTNLQLEEGTVATPFVRRSYGQELALTQRYFEKGGFFHTAYNVAGNNIGSTIKYAVVKRAAPTITQTNTSATNTSTTTNNASTGEQTESFLSFRTVTATGAAQFSEVWTSSARL